MYALLFVECRMTDVARPTCENDRELTLRRYGCSTMRPKVPSARASFFSCCGLSPGFRMEQAWAYSLPRVRSPIEGALPDVPPPLAEQAAFRRTQFRASGLLLSQRSTLATH